MPARRSFWASPGSGDGPVVSTGAGARALTADAPAIHPLPRPTWLLLVLQGQLGRQGVMALQNLPVGAAVLSKGHRAQAGEGVGGGPWDPVQDWGGRLVRSFQKPWDRRGWGVGWQKGGDLTGRGGDMSNCGHTGSGDGSSTHPEGWAHRQRLSHASCVLLGLGVGRQLGPPASLHRTSSWAHTVGRQHSE